jgi:hypothetical protein
MAKHSPALLALTASALAALGPARAQEPAAAGGPQVDYRYSNYREGDLPADRISGSDGRRYEIDTHQFRLTQPLGDETELSADLTYETMSGASPWYVIPGSGGRPVQVMSGASIRDKRADLLLGATRRRGRASSSLSAGYSTEDDYRAVNVAVQGEFTLEDTVTTLSGGLGYSDDTLEPTQGATAVSVTRADRSATTVFAGYARVLDAATVVQSSLSYTLHDGFLSDPYKQAYVVSAGATVPDARPDRRGQIAWLTRLRRFFKGAGAALHADYRYYHDDWDIDAHTVDVAWHQRIGRSAAIVPGVRYYSQSQSYFYDPYYSQPRADGLASSDYRLSPYGALSANLTLAVDVAGWGASLRYERYDSDAGYALGKVNVENPGLVDFDIVSLGLKKAF